MAVLLVLALVMVAVAALFAAAVFRWPAADPADPRLEHGRVVAEIQRHRRLRRVLQRRPDPSAATGLVVTLGGLVVVVGALSVGAVLAMVRTTTGLADFDVGVARWAARNATPVDRRAAGADLRAARWASWSWPPPRFVIGWRRLPVAWPPPSSCWSSGA